MPVYLIYLVVFFGIPILLLALFRGSFFRRYRRTFFWCVLMVVSVGGLWDWLSVRTGVWRYDSAPTLGIWFAGLPVEEFVGFYLMAPALIFLLVLTLVYRNSGSQ